MRLSLSLVLVFAVALLNAEDTPKKGRLHVGWAERDITPQQPVNLAGQFHTRITQEVDSPVTLTALAIETRDGEQSIDQAIMISCDVVMITDKMQPRLRQLLDGKLKGFDARKLFMNATHTHSAPDIGAFEYDIPAGVMTADQFVEFFLNCAAEAAIEAWDKRSPGGISFGMDYAVVGYNRRMTYADGTAAMYGANNTPKFRGVEGGEDHAVESIFFYDDSKKLTGVAVNVACPSQFLENNTKISADYWHDVREVLREKYSKDLHVLSWCGAAGDQSPHPQFRKAAESRMRALQRNVSETRAVALRIKDAVERTYEAVHNEIATDLPFKHCVEEITLPGRKITENDYRSAKALCGQFQAQMDAKKNPTAAAFLKWHSAVLDRYEHAEKFATYNVELHVLTLGNIAIATNPFELFNDYGMQIKGRSRAIQTFNIQLAAGWGGYLPTTRAVAGGGYSAIPESGFVGPEGGQMLVDRTVELINSSLRK